MHDIETGNGEPAREAGGAEDVPGPSGRADEGNLLPLNHHAVLYANLSTLASQKGNTGLQSMINRRPSLCLIWNRSICFNRRR